jgi:hypothetical protein
MRILMSAKFARRVALALFLTTVVLSVISFTAPLGLKPLVQFIGAISSLDMAASRELARRVVGIVNVDYEQNIPTWFSASVLLLNAVLLAAISSTKRALGDKYVAHWWGLSVIFLILSLDEIVGIHDKVSILLSPMLGTSGVFTYFWVIPWSVFVLLVLLAYVRFFFALSTRVKWLFLAAGGLYVGGALGGEMVLGHMVSMEDDVDERWWRLEAMAEEFLEMTGAIVFFYALTEILRAFARGEHNHAATALRPERHN